MKAPVGLLSSGAVLRSKMEGRCPDKLPGSSLTAVCPKPYQKNRVTKVTTVKVP